MPEPTPSSVEKILGAAATEKTVNLDAGEFADVLDKDEAVVERSKAALDTKKEWQALKTTIDNEKADTVENKETLEDEESKKGLQKIEQHIDQQIEDAPEAALDFKPAEAEKTDVLSTVTKFAGGKMLKAVRTILSALSSAMKALPNFTPFGINLQQLNMFESIYNKFFGAAEERENVAALLKSSGIAVREGTEDSAAHDKLHEKFATALAERLKVDSSGKSILPQADQDQIRSNFTFQKFLEKEVKDYGAKHGIGAVAKGKEKATTLMAIANGTPPAVIESSTEAAPGERMNIDVATTPDGKDVLTPFVKKFRSANVDLGDGASFSILDPVNEAEKKLQASVEIDGRMYSLTMNAAPGSPLDLLKQKVRGYKAALDSVNPMKFFSGAADKPTPREQLAMVADYAQLSKQGDLLRMEMSGIATIDLPLAELKGAIKKVKSSPDASVVDTSLRMTLDSNMLGYYDATPFDVPVTFTKKS